MDLNLWKLWIGLKRLRVKWKPLLVESVAPAFLVTSLLLIAGTSSLSYAITISQIDEAVAFDYFVDFSSSLNEDTLSSALDSLEQMSGIQEVEYYAIYTLSTEGYSFALLAFQSDSYLWDGLSKDYSNGALATGNVLLLSKDLQTPSFSPGTNISLMLTFSSGGNSYDVEMPLNITDYVSTTYDPSSLTTQMTEYADRFGTRSPDVMLVCDFDTTFLKYIESYFSEGSLTFGMTCSIGIISKIDYNLFFHHYEYNTLDSFLDEVSQEIERQSSVIGPYRVKSNINGVLSRLQSEVAALNLQMAAESLPILVIVSVSTSILMSRASRLAEHENTLLRNRGLNSRSIAHIAWFERSIIVILSTVTGIALSFLMLQIHIQLTSITPLDIPLAYWFSFLVGYAPVGAICVFALYLFVRRGHSSIRYKNSATTPPRQVGLSELSKVDVLFLLLGSYKLMTYLFGFSLSAFLFDNSGLPPYISVPLGVWNVVDTGLTYVAPFMFIWSVSRLVFLSPFILTSLQRMSDLIVGQIGQVGSRSLRQDMREVSRTGFFLLIITTLVVSAVASYESSIQYQERRISLAVGSDISATIGSYADVSLLLEEIRSLEGVADATVEYLFRVDVESDHPPGVIHTSSISIRAVNFSHWREVAYWETSWFALSPHTTTPTNSSIILEQQVASSYALNYNDTISLRFQKSIFNFTVMNFFGPTPRLRLHADSSRQYYADATWSFIPISALPDEAYQIPHLTRVLIKCRAGADYSSLVSQLGHLPLQNILTSHDTTIQLPTGDLVFQNFRMMILLFAEALGILSIAVLVVELISHKRVEFTFMRVRGIGKKEIRELLYGELIPISLLSLLGIPLGFLLTNGSNIIQNLNNVSLISYQLSIGGSMAVIIPLNILVLSSALLIPVLLAGFDSQEIHTIYSVPEYAPETP